MSRTLADILSESDADREQRSINVRYSSITTDGVPIHAEKYRSGAPFPLPYLPLKETQVAFSNAVKQVWTQLESEINQVCIKNNVDEDRFISLTYRQSEEEFRSTRGLTVLVVGSHEPRDRWSIVDSIRSLLLSWNFNEVVTEVIHPVLLRHDFLSPIFPSHPMVAGWAVVQGRIMDVLTEEEVDWQCINVLRIGIRENDNPPAVIHIVTSISTRLNVVERAEERMRAICTEASLDVEIDIAYGEVWGYCAAPGSHTADPTFDPLDPDGDMRQARNFSEHGWSLEDHEYTNRPRMGLSIGLDKLKNGAKGARGTLGGYLELVDKKGAVKLVALTCWHVIWYGMEKGPLRDQIDKDGICSSGATQKALDKIRVRQPAPQDHDDTMAYMENLICNAKRQSKDTKYGAQYQQASEEERKEYQARSDRLGAFFKTNSGFGKLFAASGFNPRIRINNRRADWALLELTKDRAGKNTLPEKKDYARYVYEGASHNKAKPFTFGQRLTSIGSLEGMNQADPVFMRGRTTGIGGGRYHCIKSVFKSRPDEGGPALFERAYLPFDAYPAFAKRGDSGAMVWNAAGQWVGLVMAGVVVTRHQDAQDTQSLVYLSEASSVKTQIENLTGMTVRLPQG